MEAIPTDLRKALATNAKVVAAWNDLTAIARRDFTRWVTSAKQAETRTRRIARTCEMLTEGKRRPCCYAVVPMSFYKALGANKKAKDQWKTLTANERRDFIAWIEEVTGSQRTEKGIQLLARGKRHP